MNVLFSIRYTESACGTCGLASGVACLSLKTFQPCFDGLNICGKISFSFSCVQFHITNKFNLI